MDQLGDESNDDPSASYDHPEGTSGWLAGMSMPTAPQEEDDAWS